MPERGDAQRRAHITMEYGKVDVTGLIVDYVEEPRFEGRIIEHTWNNMGWKPILIDKPRGNWKAGDAIAKIGPKCDVIHISAHGCRHGIARDERGKEGIRPSDLEWLFGLEGPAKKLEDVTLVVNSACNSYSTSWINLFSKKLKAACYIGAKQKPTFYEGIVFPFAFYLKLGDLVRKTLTRENVHMAFEDAKKSVHTNARWTLGTRD
jgi:hypothetical protein